jgi:hypothetical protein
VRVDEDADQTAQQVTEQVARAVHGGHVERDLREINLQTQEVQEARAQIEEQDLARVLLGAGDVGGDTGELLRDLLGGPAGVTLKGTPTSKSARARSGKPTVASVFI